VVELIIKGVVTGFILSIMVGPVFFVLLETSIRRGRRAAISFDFGVLLSDVIYVLVAFVFYSQVSAIISGERQDLLKIVGGVLFLIYGVVTYVKKTKETPVRRKKNTHRSKPCKQFIKNRLASLVSVSRTSRWMTSSSIISGNKVQRSCELMNVWR
jgi:threonine/homoserine/homoserine lactone efflux protein